LPAGRARRGGALAPDERDVATRLTRWLTSEVSGEPTDECETVAQSATDGGNEEEK
jgi:hypothetical protein